MREFGGAAGLGLDQPRGRSKGRQVAGTDAEHRDPQNVLKLGREFDGRLSAACGGQEEGSRQAGKVRLQAVAAPPFRFLDELENLLTAFLRDRRRKYSGIDPRLARATEEVATLVLGGGERLRPWFVEWGHRAAGAEPDLRLAHAAAAVEMVHAFALIQDEIIVRSGLRMGRTAVRRALAASAGDANGVPGALLASELAFRWADLLLLESGYTGAALESAFEVVNMLREELTIGQFSDLALRPSGSFEGSPAPEANHRKTARCSVLRPLQLGMALAGAQERLLEGAAAYAHPAGLAFQLRADLLSAYGDSWGMREARQAGGAVPEAERVIERLRGLALQAVRRMQVSEAWRTELTAMTERRLDRAS